MLVFYYWLVWKTTLGFDLRITGSNPIAAKFSGINPNKLVVIAMITSGGFAGLVGLGPLLGYFHRYTIDFPTGLGFAGIGVALLAGIILLEWQLVLCCLHFYSVQLRF